jgi:hypothetical protein
LLQVKSYVIQWLDHALLSPYKPSSLLKRFGSC